MANSCKSLEIELASSSVSDISPASLSHCESCASCQQAVLEATALQNSMLRLKRAGDEEMRGIDLSANLLEQIEAQRPRPWKMRFAFAAAFACLLLAVWQQWPNSSSSPLVSLDAPRGAQLIENGDTRVVRGTDIGLALPLVLATRRLQTASLRLATAVIEVGPNTHVSLGDSGTLRLTSGVIEIDSTSEEPLSPIQLTSNALPTLTLRGHAIVEHQPGKTPMKLLKRHKVIAVSAVAAVVLYSGYATITSGDSEETLRAPAGLYVDGEGKSHAFDPTQSTAEKGLAALANAAGEANGSSQGDDEGFMPSGAYWSDSEQVFQFRIRGEAFDADTGHPLDGFELTAGLVASGDFGQREAVKESFHQLDEGRFVLGGLGVGTWRITATREGYAPVIQTLEIADLQATPYLVIPLSSSGAKLSGRVIDWQGRPVADAKIGLATCLQGKTTTPPKAGCNLVSSDIHGRFVIDKLPEEEVYSLYAKHDRFGFATSNNLRSSLEEVGAGQHITIRLSGVVRIYGRVMQGKEKTPVDGAVVKGAGGEVRTSPTGDYELIVPLEENPEAYVASYPGSTGDLAIHSHPDDRSVRPLEWVDAQDHAAQVRIDFFLEMSQARLVGTIRDNTGKPMQGIEVGLTNTNGWKKARGHQTFPTKAMTDAAGNYHVDNIPAEAGYQVRYRAGENERWQVLGYVNIPEEGEVRADFELGSASIRGRFVSSESVAQMSCSRLGAERKNTDGVFTLAHCYPDGRFEIVGLQPGTYVLHSKTEWMSSSVTFEPTTVEIAAGQLLTDVEVKVEGEGAISWRFRILSTTNEFLAGAYIRYRVGNSSTTSNLHTGDDGIAQQQINESIKEIFLEVPGYDAKLVKLAENSPDDVLEVRLVKSEQADTEDADTQEADTDEE